MRTPLPPLLVAVALVVIALATAQPLIVGAAFVGALLLHHAAPPPHRLMLRIALISALFILVLNPFVAVEGDHVLIAGPHFLLFDFEVTSEELLYGLVAGLRLATAILATAAFLRLADPDRLTHPKAFLFTTARNAAIDFFRRRNVHPHESLADDDGLIELPLLDTSPTVVETMERRQHREALTEALRSLPERCREVMLLRYLDGCSGKEIAERLGISLGTVKGHLLKGVRDCARFFEARGLVDAAPEMKESV